MNDYRLETDEFEQCDILYNVLLQFIIGHRTSAVLYDYHLPVELLYVRKGFYEHLSLMKIFLFVYLFHLSPCLLEPQLL